MIHYLTYTRRIKVRRLQSLWTCIAMSALLFSIGCSGGDSGQPGSSGTEGTGTQLSIAITPLETLNVDCFRDNDCNDDGVTDDPEPFTDHLATAAIIATTYDNPITGTGSGSEPGCAGSANA